DRVRSLATVERKLRRARLCGSFAFDCLTSRGCLSRSNFQWSIGVQTHCFGFDACRVVTDSSCGVGNAGGTPEPVRDCISPNNSVPTLVLKPIQHSLVTLIVHSPFELLPVTSELLRSFCSCIVGIVNGLDHRLAGVQFVGVGHMVKEQE